MKKACNQWLKKQREDLGKFEKTKEKIERSRKRLINADFLFGVYDQKLKRLQNEIEDAHKEIKIFEKIMEILAPCRYKNDMKPKGHRSDPMEQLRAIMSGSPF